MKSPVLSRRSFFASSISVIAALQGCRKKPDAVDISHPVTKVVPLRLAVVPDPPMAAAIGRLRSEWKGLTGASFEVHELPRERLQSAQVLNADAAIIPAADLGTLVERGQVMAAQRELLDDKSFEWRDNFELLRVAEATWGSKVYAIPFGSPVLAVFYDAPLLKKLGRKPPGTWQEYQELVDLLDEQRPAPGQAAKDVWVPTVEPLKGHWAGHVLLARSAAYAKHPENFSALFDIETMRPLINGPPFVRALEELATAAKRDPARHAELDSRSAIDLVAQGHCAMAIGSTAGLARASAATAGSSARIAVAELPGSADVYDFSHKSWATHAGGTGCVPLLSFSGRLGVVLESASDPEQAWRLLAWLSGARWGQKISSASSGTSMYRRSQLSAAADWIAGTSIDPQSYAGAVEHSLSRSTWLSLRLPGHEEYQAALDEAVRNYLLKRVPAAQALAGAADRWQAITKRFGIPAQRRAYRRSVGLEE